MLKRSPKFVKFSKYHKVNYNYKYLLSESAVPHYYIALQCLESATLEYKELESCRRTIRRGFRIYKEFFLEKPKLLFRVALSTPLTKKSLCSRMGKGKGNTYTWIAPLRKGQIIFEIVSDINSYTHLILKKAQSKLSVKTNIVYIYF